jgi:hypothetical protein
MQNLDSYLTLVFSPLIAKIPPTLEDILLLVNGWTEFNKRFLGHADSGTVTKRLCGSALP